MKFKTRLVIIIVTTLFLGFLFYWFEVRVTEIRKNCAEKILEIKGFGLQDYNVAIKLCLYKHGINE